MVNCMRSAPERAVDSETNGLKFANGKKPIGWSMGFLATDGNPYAWYMPVAHAVPEYQVPEVHAKAALRDALQGAQALLFHHGKFDLNIARANGWEIPTDVPIHDTLPQAYLIFERREFQLEKLIAEHGLSPYGDPFEMKHKVEDFIRFRAREHKMGLKRSKDGRPGYKETYGHSEVPISVEGEYSCRDIGHTLVLDRYQRDKAMAVGTPWEDRGRWLYHNEMLLVRALADMEFNGQPLDKQYLLDQTALIDIDLEKRESDLGRSWGVRIDWGNDEALRDLLFNHLGFKPVNWTSGGTHGGPRKPSVDRSTLLQLRTQQPTWAPALMDLSEYKQWAKARSTYTETFAWHVCNDGKVHFNVNQGGAKSGRLSANDPNLQNIPMRHEASAKMIRRAFGVLPGQIRLYCDYSQIELRVLAYITGCGTLQQAYKSPAWDAFRRGYLTYDQYREARSHEQEVDVHALQAIRTFGSKETDHDWKVKRRAAKVINFGVPYGMGWIGLNGNPDLLLPERDAKEYFARYHQANPEINSTKNQLFNAMIRHSHPLFVNWAGRRVHCAELRSTEKWMRAEGERSSFASLVQGSAAELTRISIVRLWQETKAGTLPAVATSTVHDEIQFDCDKKDLSFVASRTQTVMEDFHNYFGLPIVCGLEASDTNWAEKKEQKKWPAHWIATSA